MIDKVIAKVEEQLAAGIYPGASLSFYEQGNWHSVYLGQSNPQDNQVTKPNLVYDLASVSKVVGVGTVMIFLIQSGQIELDKPFKDYYPAFENEEVTIRQLMTHTSGLDPFIPNRDKLNAQELREAMHRLKVKGDKSFHYTDVNFVLLGFLVEKFYGQSLDEIFQREIFQPWQMTQTSFGPRTEAVPMVRGQLAGVVHDPKARVLGVHAGSAGLFSTVTDLQRFVEHYLQDDFAKSLTQNYSKEAGQPRSLAWRLEGDWLDHTGYTGTFLLLNIKEQKAVIFLTNRTYDKDERLQWIADRDQLMALIRYGEC